MVKRMFTKALSVYYVYVVRKYAKTLLCIRFRPIDIFLYIHTYIFVYLCKKIDIIIKKELCKQMRYKVRVLRENIVFSITAAC